MSAYGTKRTLMLALSMSVYRGKADIGRNPIDAIHEFTAWSGLRHVYLLVAIGWFIGG
jgi:hypothetical protein